MIDPDIQILLDQKQDLILSDIAVSQDGQKGDIRTNIPSRGKMLMAMKGGEDTWLFSTPFSRVPSNRTMDDYLLLSGGVMQNGSKIENLGTLDIVHTATEPDDHALEIEANAAGFGDIKAIEIDYITGAIADGQDEGIILLNIDESLATGGEVLGLEVLATEGLANIWAVKAAALVGPILQNSGVFADMDSALVNAVDRRAEFISAALTALPR